MKKILLSVVLSCLAVATLRADLIWYENFNYPDGQIILTSTNLAGTTNWVRHSGTAGNAFVINKKLEVATSRADDVNRKFPAEFTAAPMNLYASFTANYTNVPTITNYFAHFVVGDTTLHARIFSAPGNLPNTWKLGITTAVSTIGLVKFLPVDLATNIDYQVVVQWDTTQGINAVPSLWLNPISASDPSAIAGDTLSPAPAASLGFGFRQASGGATTLVNITNLAVATTFEEAATNVWSTNALPPVVVYQPKGGTNFPGNSVLLSAVATGQGLGSLTYTWLKDGVLYDDPNNSPDINQLSFPSAVESDSGNYQLVVTTPYGLTATSTVASLWVTNSPIPPIITKQPTNSSVYFGQTATFSVSVIGPGSINYTWKRNGVLVSGAPNIDGPVLTIPNVQTNVNTGTYTCSVSNEYGGVVSSGAVLSAVPIPAVSIAFLRTLVDPTTYNATNSTILYQATGTVTTFTNLTTGNTSSYYLQDSTAGINIFATFGGTFRPALGDRVTFVGVLSSFNSTLELVVDANNIPGTTNYIVSSGNPLPASKVIPFNLTNNLAASEALEGSLVMLTNVFFGTNEGGVLSTTANVTVTVTNGAGETFLLFFSAQDQDTAGQTLPGFAWSVKGPLTQNLNNTLVPRNQGYSVTVTRFSDIVTNEPPAVTTADGHTGNSTTLTWTAVPYDYSYSVLAATTPAGPYLPIATGLTFTTANGTYTDTNAGGSQKYYRVVSP